MAYSAALEKMEAPVRPEETVSNPQNILASLTIFEENVLDYSAIYRSAVLAKEPIKRQQEMLRSQILGPIAVLKESLQTNLAGGSAVSGMDLEDFFVRVTRGIHRQVSFVREYVCPDDHPKERKNLLGRLDKLSGDLGRVYRGDPVVKGAGLVFNIA